MKTSTLLWILGGTAVGAGVAYYIYTRSQQGQQPTVNVFVPPPKPAGLLPPPPGSYNVSLTPEANLVTTPPPQLPPQTGAKFTKIPALQMAAASNNSV